MASSSSLSSNVSFDILQLPSIKQGMTKEEEADKRLKTCRFMEEASRRLKLPQVAKATAMVFFHRFYAKHSFQEHDRFEVAVASLVLAAKVEESPKRVDKVISECIELKNASSQSGRLSTKPTSLVGGSGSGEGASSSISPKAGGDGAMDQKGDEFMKLKERILLLERIHLHTIGFDLFVEHPYKFIVEKVKTLTIGRKLKYKDGTTVAEATKSLPPSQLTQKMSAEIMQYSINFANDSLFTSLCLQFGPDQIATSSLFMACCYADIEPLNGPDEWMDVLDHPDLEALVSICEQVLDTLDKKRGSDINKNNKIRTMLDVWRVSASSGVGREDVNGSSSKHPASTPPPSAGSPKRMRTEP